MMRLALTICIILSPVTASWACPLLDDAAMLSFSPPVGGPVVSGFGPRHNPILNTTRLHTGVDFAAAMGDPVRATGPGVVMFAGEQAGYGRYARLRHVNGFETTYGHLSELAVRTDDCVATGGMIGRAGGTRSGSHLHFEILWNGRFIDPVYVMERGRLNP